MAKTLRRRNYTWAQVKARLNRALARLATDDRRLIERRVHERTIAQRLTVYLDDKFTGWNVHFEFNRQGPDARPKEIRRGRGRVRVLPDIIVHVPRPEGPNLLAIEVKPMMAPEDNIEKDRTKLRGYLADHDYRFAALVTYAIDDWEVERVRLLRRRA